MINRVSRYNVQVLGLAEHGLNFAKDKASFTLPNMFEREMSVPVQVTAAFNTSDNPTGNVQGGTAILTFDDFTQYAQDYGVDPRGLGCWSISLHKLSKPVMLVKLVLKVWEQHISSISTTYKIMIFR